VSRRPKRWPVVAFALAAMIGAAVVGATIGRRSGSPATGTTAPRSSISRPKRASGHHHTQRPAPAPRLAADWVNANLLRRRVAMAAQQTHSSAGVVVEDLAGHRRVRAGALQHGAGWSTMKIPVILARYRLAEESGEAVSALGSRVTNAITRSDNAAAESLFDDLVASRGGVVAASHDVEQVLRSGGDHATRVNTVPPPGGFSTFGQTDWSLADGAAFFRSLALGCIAPAAADRRVLQLMGQISPDQRWGIGAARFAGSRSVGFKGGWGPGPDGRYLVRQFAVVRGRNGGVVLGLAVRASDGSFEGGVGAITHLAQAVASALRVGNAPSSSCTVH
jgi:hypothetical protein